MDEALKPIRILCTASVLLAAHGALCAQELQDPTRPPAQLIARADGAPAASGAPRLQSVLIGSGPDGRHVAVIDGETVRLGEVFHGARLVRMTRNEVELVRGRERQVLKLNAPSAAAGSAPPR
jgi:MSHA biogenesis protein MshK